MKRMTNPLKQHLETTGETQQKFALRIGVRSATVSAWCNGTTPRPEQMKRIEKATSGAVPVMAWFVSQDTAA